MPELPEVETTLKGLKNTVKELKILDVWTDCPKLLKEPKSFNVFKRHILGKRIKDIKRRGKYLVFCLDSGWALIIHQKMTGHLLTGSWKRRRNKWKPTGEEVLHDRVNSYIHLMFKLSKGKMMALSDLRKFATVVLVKKERLKKLRHFNKLGPDPLKKNYTLIEFLKSLESRKGRIKQILLNQEIIAGIGNIYSDEILWNAGINPEKQLKELDAKSLKKIYLSMRRILKKAIKLKGDSMSDYRDVFGEKGGFQKVHKVYRRGGKSCFRCFARIQRCKIGGRSSCYCPVCQPLV